MKKAIRFLPASSKVRNAGLSARFAAAALCAAALHSAAWAEIQQFDIAFSGYAGSSALTDFPVLVRLSSARNGFDASACRADGADVRFYGADGALLSSELDTWNPSGESLFWVKVPSLAKDTTITCRYGFASAAPSRAADVWSNGYVAVWHLGESELPLADSASDPAPFTASNALASAAFAAAGKIGGAVDFSPANQIANASGKYQSWVSAADADKLDGFTDFTVELWVCDVEASSQQMYMGKRVDSSTGSWWIYKNSGSGKAMNLTATADGSNGKSVATATPVANAWNHVAFVRDTAEGKGYGYLAGALTGTTSLNAAIKTGALYAGAGDFYLGDNYAAGNNRCQGMIDEVRISGTVRSADWIRATHDCVANDAFATYTAPASQTANDWDRYAKRFTVSFPGAPETALEDFPVLIRLSEGSPAGFSYADCALADGGDLRFADADGNLLASEVDTWNTNGESLVWVRVPSLSSATRIKGRYGWSGAPAMDGAAVWDASYVGVWHLGESALPLAESTGVSTPFSSYNCMADDAFGAAGVAGGAVDFTQTVADAQDKVRQYLSAEHDADLGGFTGGFTVEFWTKRADGATGNRYVVTKRASNTATAWEIFQTAGANCGVFQATADGATLAYVIEGKNDGMLLGYGGWYHQAYVFDPASSQGLGYVNGNTPFAYSTSFAGPVFDGETPLYLGNRQSGNSANGYNGLVDEVRISKVARSAAWVKASHDTVAASGFASYGAARANENRFLIVIR